MRAGTAFLFAGLTFVLVALVKLMNDGGGAGAFLAIGLALIAFGAARTKRGGGSDAR